MHNVSFTREIIMNQPDFAGRGEMFFAFMLCQMKFVETLCY